MAVYRGPYTSLDLTQGVWLDVERDELGNSRHWMTIEGEEIELTEKQHQVLMEQRVEAHKNAAKLERERIIKLLEEAKVINTDQKFFLISSIKGEQK